MITRATCVIVGSSHTTECVAVGTPKLSKKELGELVLETLKDARAHGQATTLVLRIETDAVAVPVPETKPFGWVYLDKHGHETFRTQKIPLDAGDVAEFEIEEIPVYK